MADYYTKLSFMVPFKGAEAEFFQGILQYAEKGGAGDDPPADIEPKLLEAAKEALSAGGEGCPDIEVEAQGDELWISDGGGTPNLEFLAEAIRQTLLRFRDEVIIAFQWSNDCSKPRTDAYGGGACVISARRKRWLSTGMWLEGVVEKWSKKK